MRTLAKNEDATAMATARTACGIEESKRWKNRIGALETDCTYQRMCFSQLKLPDVITNSHFSVFASQRLLHRATATITMAPLIKGYLPLRLKLPSGPDGPEETFFYVKEHQSPSTVDSTNSPADGGTKKRQRSRSDTLFVINAPVVPPVQTDRLLKSLFGRYGEVKRVTVVKSPPKKAAPDQQKPLTSFLEDRFATPSFLARVSSQGKFAHVVFTSNNEMKRALQSLHDIMTDRRNDDGLTGLSMDSLEIRTLTDDNDNEEEEEPLAGTDKDDIKLKTTKRLVHSAVFRVAERYRRSCRGLDRDKLMDECNAVMQEYEDAEEQDRRTREADANQPDEDGFVTVSYSSQVGSKRELEVDRRSTVATDQRQRRGHKRSRKKKDANGSSELTDFYRFQTKVNRKKSVQELRERFEQDLARVQRMKEERQYKPF